MNNERRKELKQAIKLLKQAIVILNKAAYHEQKYYDNMPDPIRSGEKGMTAVSTVDKLESSVSDIEAVIERIVRQ